MIPESIIIAVSTVCGRTGHSGFASTRDRNLLESMRDRTDASLMGAGTLRDADPEMRCSKGRLPENRIRAFVTASGRIPCENRKVFQAGPMPLIFTGAGKVAALKQKLAGKAEIVNVPESETGLSIREIMKKLWQMGVKSVLVEGGGKLNYSCLAESAVDEIMLTFAPFVSGKADASSFSGSGIMSLIKLELLECVHSKETGEIFTRYRVIK